MALPQQSSAHIRLWPFQKLACASPSEISPNTATLTCVPSVSYGGKRALVVRYRVNRRLHRLTLGSYPDLSLADARRTAREVLGDVARGDDPAQDKQERRGAETFGGLAKSYPEVAEKRPRCWKEEKRIIDKDLLPEFGFRLLADIRRRDVRDFVEAIARKRNAPIMANRTLAVLSRTSRKPSLLKALRFSI